MGCANQTFIKTDDREDISLSTWISQLPEGSKVGGDGGYLSLLSPNILLPAHNPYPEDPIDPDSEDPMYTALRVEWNAAHAEKRVIVENVFARAKQWKCCQCKNRNSIYIHAMQIVCVFLLVDEDMVDRPLRP